MKRDIDLARQLLLDIENEAQDCAISRLRELTLRETAMGETVANETNDNIRYHLRLLIDAGFVKEVDRTTAGVPCVRLTHAGHELVELSRSDIRWRDAKQFTRETTGGLSLTVIRAVLVKWAVEAGVGRRYRAPRRLYRPYAYRVEPRRYDSGRYESGRRVYEYREPVVRESIVREPVVRDQLADEELQLVRTRPDYRERSEVRDRVEYRDRYDAWDRYDRDVAATERYEYVTDAADGDLGVSLPIYLV